MSMKKKASLRYILERLSTSEILAEIERRLNVERDLKNAAFSFLIKKGLYYEFNNWLNDKRQEK